MPDPEKSARLAACAPASADVTHQLPDSEDLHQTRKRDRPPRLIAGQMRLQRSRDEHRGDQNTQCRYSETDAINHLPIFMEQSPICLLRARQTPPEEAESAGRLAPSTVPYIVWYY